MPILPRSIVTLPTFHQQRLYCRMMFSIIANGLVSASRHDIVIRQELQTLPVGLTIQMQILPNHANFYLQINEQHQLVFSQSETQSLEKLTITIKHLQLAMFILTFRESTAQSIANNRMTVDGDITHAVRFVRILHRLQVLILPKFLAKRAVKQYPKLAVWGKIRMASRIYCDILCNLFKSC